MWIYRQSTGALLYPNGERLATGYSGCGDGKNNPALQHVRDVGPCPCGVFDIEAPIDDDRLGKYVLGLSPRVSNQMFGRAGFYLHGDSLKHPGAASHGCVIEDRDAREAVWESGDHVLQVIP